MNVETAVAHQHVHQYDTIGVDLGLKTAATFSHGAAVVAPKPLQAASRKLRKANRVLHRRKKGGRNRDKARAVLARVHVRLANIRKDFWHKLTTTLCRENQTVVIEDLNMSFMLRNRKLARSAADVALGMLRPMLLYKAEAYGTQIVVADKFFPSTQRCASCGSTKTGKDKLVLGESEYVCEECGVCEDRDLNAALNLEQYPRLAGNWGPAQTPMDDHTSTLRVKACEASEVAEVGTKPCSLLSTD